MNWDNNRVRRPSVYRGYRARSRPKAKVFRWLRAGTLSSLVLAIAAVLFIKFDTAGAAGFADNYLRPIVGSNNVILMEKVFFNLSDKVRKVTSNNRPQSSPLLRGQGKANLPGGHLNLKPLSVNSHFKPVHGEGIWREKPLSIFRHKEVMAYTFTRPDPHRSYASVTLVQVASSLVKMGSVAGIKQPGGPVGKPGPGKVPRYIVKSGNLIAAFDGGFLYRDGAYGMIVGKTTYVPLKKDVGTIVGYNDGSMRIINYTGQHLGNHVAFVRQNCPILIDNGDITIADPRSKAKWGRTLTAGIYTWRSAVGLTKNGNLVFAVGNNLTPLTLANALKSAGVINAIQLDINPHWVRFDVFNSTGGGKYASTTLMKGVTDGTKEFLHGYQKDFFYLYKK